MNLENNHRYAVVVQDWATRFNHIRVQQKLRRTRKVLKKPSRKPKVIYTDNSLEFGKACEELFRNNCTSTPHRSETNGIAEREVHRIEEGTSAVLLQSGFDEKWWADSMECYCYLRHIQDLLADGRTPYETRFGEPFKRPIIPFGSSVEYHPFPRIISQESINLERTCSLESSSDMYCTRKGIWKGDLLIVDLVELEEMNASEIHAKRLKAKEVIVPKKWWKLQIPDRRWTSKIYGGDQAVRTSTWIRNQRFRGESRQDILGESEGSPPTTYFQDSFPWSTRWFLVHFGRLHTLPSRWTKGQTLHAEGRVISYSTEIYWRHQGHSYNLGCVARKPHRW